MRMENNIVLLQVSDLKKLLSEMFEHYLGVNRREETPPEDDGKYMTRDEVCAMLHITYTTLWRMEKRGEIRAHKIGRRSLYAKADVEALVKNANSGKEKE